jgi:predicted Zn-dependent protease
MNQRLLAVLALAISMTGCAVNPVTGKPDFMMVSEAQELAIGAQNYAPMQQAEGGAYDIDPKLTAYVREVGNKLAAVSDRPLPYEFVVLNNSVPNAWALPGGKIAINRGLLTELNSEAELAAVLGHEIVHAAAKHSAQQMSRGVLLQSAVLATAMVTGDNSFGHFAVGSAAVGAQLLSSTYGRSAELESDKYGMTYMSRAGYDPAGAVTLQETFVRLSEGQDSDWLSGLFASHPPSRARVDANRKTAASLPPGGITGVDRYQAAMQTTLALKPAYDAYDEGRAALADKKTAEALVRAEKAIELFPDEGHFYALRGDIRSVDGKYDMASKNYDSAIERRDDYFYYYLRRGLARKELGQVTGAKTDLERSIEMLPTGPAHYVLGDIEAEQGNVEKAIEHYAVVANSGGEIGQAATQKLQRLKLPSSPGEVIPRRCDADSAGNLVVSVKNTTPWAIEGVQIEVRYTDAAGRAQVVRQTIPNRIPPGEIASINTGLGPYSSGSCPAEVTAARYAE